MTKCSYENRLLRVQLYIQQQLDRKLSLDELAREASFSPFHFHRIFRAFVGESVGEYVRRLRLERSALNLKFSDSSVTQLAFDAGYESHEAFTRAFRAQFGVSPSAFRKSYQFETPRYEYEQQGRLFQQTRNQEGQLNMKAEIKKLKPRTVAYVRHIGPYNECAQAWMKLAAAPAVQQSAKSGNFCCGACYDDPDITDAGKIRYDACMEVNDDFEPANGIGKQRLAGGDYIVATHEGSYMNLHKTYDWLYREWLAKHEREASSSPSLEIYLNNPEDTPEDELRTQVCIPLK